MRFAVFWNTNGDLSHNVFRRVADACWAENLGVGREPLCCIGVTMPLHACFGAAAL